MGIYEELNKNYIEKKNKEVKYICKYKSYFQNDSFLKLEYIEDINSLLIEINLNSTSTYEINLEVFRLLNNLEVSFNYDLKAYSKRSFYTINLDIENISLINIDRLIERIINFL